MTENKASRYYQIWNAAEQGGLYGVKQIVPFFREQGLQVSNLALERAMHRTPIEEFVYPGTIDTLKWLRDNDDLIDIWTLGDPTLQTWKVAGSDIGKLRKGDTPELTRQRRSQIRLHASLNKIAHLPDIISENLHHRTRHVFILDDKSTNILNVNQVLQEWKGQSNFPQNVTFHPVWINQGRTKEIVPDGYDFSSFTSQFITIHSITELKTLRDQFSKERGDCLWEIDYDHTIANTKDWEMKAFSSL